MVVAHRKWAESGKAYGWLIVSVVRWMAGAYVLRAHKIRNRT